MISTTLTIVDNVLNFLLSLTTKLGVDLLFVVGLGFEVVLVLFFLIKAAASYEVALNRALDKLNYWLFQKKVVNEENIRSLNALFKTKAPKRLTYYWHQYVLFREGAPSHYFTAENVIEKQTKTSSFASDIRNLAIFTAVWSVFATIMVFICMAYGGTVTGMVLGTSAALGFAIALIGSLFVVFMKARKNAVVSSLYQSLSLFNRFMDNACLDLTTYVDYQILFTPAEIEKGQPVLREFLDFKARKEKEEFAKAKEEQIDYVTYDFSETGVDGSIVLDRAMRESELFLNRREKLLIQISQLEAELESRKKNFDNVQRDSQTKIQASKENIARLRQMQEETTNRIESNYYRKQQTQEASKQEQLEQEFEQQRAKYLLEKGEVEQEIAKLNEELEGHRKHVEEAMLGEYKTFFDKFCHSAEKVVAKVFADRINALKIENDQDKAYITELELKLKNLPQEETETPAAEEGHYDENGNYVYANGTYYDPDGRFHDTEGNIYSQDGTLLGKDENAEKVVDLNQYDTFEFMTDVEQKDDIYDVAENVIHDIDAGVKVVNSGKEEHEETPVEEETPQPEEPVAPVESATEELESFSLDEEPTEQAEEPVVEEPAEKTEEVEEAPVVEEKPRRKAGRPRKIVKEEEPEQKKRGRPRKQPVVEPTRNKVGRPKKEVAPQPKKNKVGRPKKVAAPAVEEAPKRKVGRPKKEAAPAPTKNKVGRPKKVTTPAVEEKPKRKVGRPKKIVKAEEVEPKKGRGRPKKNVEKLHEINRKLDEEEAKLAEMREELNAELEVAMDNVNGAPKDNTQDRRTEIMKEIDSLQAEAQRVMAEGDSEAKMQEINEKLEKLLDEIKTLNA